MLASLFQQLLQPLDELLYITLAGKKVQTYTTTDEQSNPYILNKTPPNRRTAAPALFFVSLTRTGPPPLAFFSGALFKN